MPQGCAKKIQFQLLLADLPLKLRYPTRRGRRIVRGQRNRRRNGRAGVLFSRRSQCRICRHSRGLSCFSWFAWFARLDQHRTRTASVTQRRRAASQIMALPAIQQRPLNIQFSSQCLHIRCGVHPRQSRKFEFTRVLSMSSPGHCSSPRTVWQISVSQFRGAVQTYLLVSSLCLRVSVVNPSVLLHCHQQPPCPGGPAVVPRLSEARCGRNCSASFNPKERPVEPSIRRLCRSAVVLACARLKSLC